MTLLLIGQRDWYSRLLAIMYAWTVGLAVGVITLPVALLYALMGTILKALGVGNVKDIPFWGTVKTIFAWWFSIHDHAISGTGTYELTPPIFD